MFQGTRQSYLSEVEKRLDATYIHCTRTFERVTFLRRWKSIWIIERWPTEGESFSTMSMKRPQLEERKKTTRYDEDILITHSTQYNYFRSSLNATQRKWNICRSWTKVQQNKLHEKNLSKPMMMSYLSSESRFSTRDRYEESTIRHLSTKDIRVYDNVR